MIFKDVINVPLPEKIQPDSVEPFIFSEIEKKWSKKIIQTLIEQGDVSVSISYENNKRTAIELTEPHNLPVYLVRGVFCFVATLTIQD